MKIHRRVVWSEGMFMAPQHMQLLDAFHEGQLEARLAVLPGDAWGVAALEIDASALSLGELRVLRFAGVLPDGLVAQFEAEDAPPARAIKGHLTPTTQSLDVYLAAPREREGVPAYEGPGVGAARRPRWSRVTRTVQDRVAGASEVELELAEPRLELLFGDEGRGEHEVIKIAEIERNAAGGLVLSPSYIPPVLRIDASVWLTAELGKLLTLMIARQRRLAEACRQRDGASVEFMGSDVTRFLLLSAVNAKVPLLRYAVETGELSPRALYLQLIELAGALGTFSPDGALSGVAKFAYLDLRGTFGELLRQLTALLGAAAFESDLRVALERRADGTFVGKLLDERVLASKRYFLAVRAELPEAQLAEQLPRLAKVATVADIHQFVQAALPGVPVQVTYRPPAQIAVRSGVVYFALDTSHASWRSVVYERSIAIYLPPMLGGRQVEVELLVIPEG